MDGSLSNKPKIFLDDPEKIYRQRRLEARSRKPELVDPKVEADDSSSSSQATPPTSPEEAPLHQGMALPEPERTIRELCTPDVRDLPIQNLDNIGVPFEIKTSIIRAMSLAALETSSLPSSGVVTPSATLNTNLSLLTQNIYQGSLLLVRVY